MTQADAAERRRWWLPAALSVLLIAAALAGLAVLGGHSLPDRVGPPVEELSVETTRFTSGEIELTVRNTGPDPVSIGQVFVNDVYVDFAGAEDPIRRLESETLLLKYPWQDGQPYTVSMLTSTGVVIEHAIALAVATPEPTLSFFALMALLGTYVGILPVVLGMMLLPVMRQAGESMVRLLLAFTVGLLLFLTVDGISEGLEIGGMSGGAFGGAELVILGAVVAFLILTAVDRYLRDRHPGGATGVRLAAMVAVGIGLHNFGEGLAIGSAYAIGELALGASLVVGFALHNTTEGIAIVAPLTRRASRPPLWILGVLGLAAGAPAIVGAVVGATVNNAELSALLLGVGVGAIVQVIVQLAPSLAGSARGKVGGTVVLAILGGVVVMYGTGLLVPA
ncbi:ZIP family metal transporter [Antrihabitans sp. YC3-6]|uniref:ZIP family metal transporter n=1 Tax=Antrihabitans stalagmiti TaxID=2799499 RepID=A0A934U4W0_9NOCA|nr:ZIP family metal transporter [Antrihabitans stalagmiti]MBJ8340816.1 ZIP family metal transporter [Antrihabitans stalagmiti]